MDSLRARFPELLLLDLGNFAPIDFGRARPEPRAAVDLDSYLAAMARMGYDAVNVGPEDLLGGQGVVRSEAAPHGLGLLGCGLELRGRPAYRASEVFERAGRRVGFVGFSEPVEYFTVHEAHEANLAEVAFPADLGVLEAVLRELRPQVDVLVVGGYLTPWSLDALCRSEVGVDAVLLAGYGTGAGLLERPVGFLHGTLVAAAGLGPAGLHRLDLFFSASGRIVSADRTEHRLPGPPEERAAPQALFVSPRDR